VCAKTWAQASAWFLSSVAACGAALPDDAGSVLQRARPAQRIVAVSPHLAELAFTAGAGDKLVGVVRGSDEPPAAQRLPSVGDASGLDFERITALRPDLILAWGSGNRSLDIERLRRMGITVYVAEPRRLEDIGRHLRAIGEMSGSTRIAEAAAARFEAQLSQLRSRHGGGRMRSVFVEVWRQPLFTLGERHLMSDALRVCSARNAIESLPADAAPVPLEWLLQLDPDAIVSIVDEPEEATRSAWSAFSRLKAVRNGAVFSLPPEIMVRATPRILMGIERLCQDLEKLP
jgi:iron complex transport system substrate-binding protein